MDRRKVARFDIICQSFPIYEGMNIIGVDQKGSMIINDSDSNNQHAALCVVKDIHYVVDFNCSKRTKIGELQLKPLIFYKIQDNSCITIGEHTGTYHTQSVDCEDSMPQLVENLPKSNNKPQVDRGESILCDDTLNFDDNMAQSFSEIIVDDSLIVAEVEARDEDVPVQNDSGDETDDDIDLLDPTQPLVKVVPQKIVELEVELNKTIDDDIDFLAPTQALTTQDMLQINNIEEEKNESSKLQKPDDFKFVVPEPLNASKSTKKVDFNDDDDIDFLAPTQELMNNSINNDLNTSLNIMIHDDFVIDSIPELPDQSFNSRSFISSTQVNNETVKLENKSIIKADFSAPTQKLDENINESAKKINESIIQADFSAPTQKQDQNINESNTKVNANTIEADFSAPTEKLDKNIDENSEKVKENNIEADFSAATQKLKMADSENDFFLIPTQKLVPQKPDVKNTEFSKPSPLKITRKKKPSDFEADFSAPTQKLNEDDYFLVPTQKLIPSSAKISKIETNFEKNDDDDLFMAPTQELMNKEEAEQNFDQEDGDFLAPTQKLSGKSTEQKTEQEDEANINKEPFELGDDDDFLAPTQILSGESKTNVETGVNMKKSVSKKSKIEVLSDSDGSDIEVQKKRPSMIKETQVEEDSDESEVGYKHKKVTRLLDTQELSSEKPNIVINNFSVTEDDDIIIPNSQLEESMALMIEESPNKPKPKEPETQFELDLPTEKEFMPVSSDRPDNPLALVFSSEETQNLETQEIPPCENKKVTKDIQNCYVKIEFTAGLEKKIVENNSKESNEESGTQTSSALGEFSKLLNKECDKMSTPLSETQSNIQYDITQVVLDSDEEDYGEYFEMDTQPIGLNSPLKKNRTKKNPDVNTPSSSRLRNKRIHEKEKEKVTEEKKQKTKPEPTRRSTRSRTDESTSEEGETKIAPRRNNRTRTEVKTPEEVKNGGTKTRNTRAKKEKSVEEPVVENIVVEEPKKDKRRREEKVEKITESPHKRSSRRQTAIGGQFSREEEPTVSKTIDLKSKESKTVEKVEEFVVPKRTTRRQTVAGGSMEKEAKTEEKKTQEQLINNRVPSGRTLKLKPKVVFTMIDNANLEATVMRLGGTLVNSSQECTVLVTNKISRSLKFLVAVSLGKPIVGIEWIIESGKAHHFLDPWDYILSDQESETKFEFKLRNAITLGGQQKIFQEYTLLLAVSKNVDVLKAVIEACGGKSVTRVSPKSAPDNLIVISYEEDRSKYSKYLKQKPPVPVYAAEAIFAGVLRQELNLEKHVLR